MKKVLLSLFCLLSLGSAYAEGGHYLHVRTSAGWKVLDLETVDRLTFTSGTMVASDADNKTVETFDRGSLEKMYFDETPETTGIGQEAVADATEATFRLEQSTATMLADGVFEVYSIDGSLLVSINAKKGESIDLSAIAVNAVIAKSGSFTIKANLR